MKKKLFGFGVSGMIVMCAAFLCVHLTGCNLFRTDPLVNAGWVKTLIDTKNNGKPLVIAEVSWGGPTDYDKGHIPGAIHVNTDEIEYDFFTARDAGPVERSTTAEEDTAKGLSTSSTLQRNWWDIYPDQYLFPAFAYMGINIDTTVVVYGSEPIAAARLAWALLYAGVKDVRFLDGGLNAWTAAGYVTSTEPTSRTPVADFGTTKPLHPEYLVNSTYVRGVIAGVYPNSILADVRTNDEYTGKTTPYSYIPTSGRVKGALWAHDSSEYLDETGKLKPLSDIKALWKESGITGDKHVSFYCGTGWRSSLAWLCAYRMGWNKISNFDDSWYKWSMGPDKDINPVEDDYPNLP